MGALVALELARALQEAGSAEPDHFIASACRAPGDLRKDKAWHTLPDDELIAALTALGAAPEPFQVEELRELALPVLRADLQVVEEFDTASRTPLRCPITAVAGTEDPDAKPELMAGWARETVGGFHARTVAGGHFLIEERPADMVNVIRDALNG
jgi:medium-chain acyl-[acyl-carrier-protein] hydrolase